MSCLASVRVRCPCIEHSLSNRTPVRRRRHKNWLSGDARHEAVWIGGMPPCLSPRNQRHLAIPRGLGKTKISRRPRSRGENALTEVVAVEFRPQLNDNKNRRHLHHTLFAVSLLERTTDLSEDSEAKTDAWGSWHLRSLLDARYNLRRTNPHAEHPASASCRHVPETVFQAVLAMMRAPHNECASTSAFASFCSDCMHRVCVMPSFLFSLD